LAPTVGPAAALAGVEIRTGSVIASSGERVVSGLVQRFGSLDFVSDNLGCFGSMPFPRGGSFINFGAHQVYVAVRAAPVYPEKVHVAADPPAMRGAARGRLTASPVSSAEVLMTAPGADAGGGGAGKLGMPAKATRSRGPPLERTENLAGGAGTTADPATPTVLQAAIDRLKAPVDADAGIALTQAQLQEQRQDILQEAIEVAKVRQEFDITLREYNRAHGFTPVSVERPSRIEELRARGRNLNADIDRAGGENIVMSASYISAARPTYSTPAKNLRAAQAAAAELSSLTGDALRK